MVTEFSDFEKDLSEVMGSQAASIATVSGGYSSARRCIVKFADGRQFFVKAATDSDTANWLRAEHNIYANIEAEFLPKMVGWQDKGDFPILVLEDLSSGLWPTQWTTKSVASVLDVLHKLRRVIPPSDLPTLESMRDQLVSWRLVSADPSAFLSLKLCSSQWLENALRSLIDAESKAVLAGDELLHLDVRSDNICFIDDRVLLVDWNWACVGNANLDAIFWLPSVALEGGPRPQDVLQADPDLVALIAGFWAFRAGTQPPRVGSRVREIQRKQLEVALPWCALLLGLPPLDGAIH